MEFDDEVKRLISPPPPVPSFWRYLRDKNPWAYYNVGMSLLGCIAAVVLLNYRWMAIGFGLILGVSLANVWASYGVYKRRVALQREREAWVEKLATRERGFPRPIAQAMSNFIEQDKAHAAAALAIEYLKMTDPEARRHFEEFDALPEDEKERRRAEAMAQADADIARERNEP